MRALIATDQWFPDVRGGLARVAMETAVRLTRAGHEATVICPRSNATHATVHEARLAVHRIVPHDRLPRTVVDQYRVARAVRRVADGRYDVLVGHTATDCLGLLRGGIDAPLVYVFHASPVLEARFLHRRVGLGRDRVAAYVLDPALASAERRALRAADRVLVLSEFSRSVLAERDAAAARDAIRVSGAVDTTRFSPGDRLAARERLGVRREARLVFTARRLVPRMGLEELVAASILLRGEPELEVAIAGDGALRQGLATRIVEDGAPAYLVGRVSDEELVDWYRAADLVVMPTVAYEGFGLVTAEALACGTPVVGTPVGATPEILRQLDETLLAEGSDPASLARGIERVLRTDEAALRSRCRKFAVEELSWESVLPSWESAIFGTRGGP